MNCLPTFVKNDRKFTGYSEQKGAMNTNNAPNLYYLITYKNYYGFLKIIWRIADFDQPVLLSDKKT